MKKILGYIALMLLAVIILPFFIVWEVNKDESEKEQTLQAGIKVKVYFTTEQKIREMILEDYLKGVVAAEMPAEFDPEALKAQAVAARSYTYSKMKKLNMAEDNLHPDADICTDYTHCQAWIGKKDAMKNWGILSASKYWSKIEKAVDGTAGMVAVYDSKPINAVFHSNSGGKTDNAEEVWKSNAVPYLKSVASEGEQYNPEYKNTVTLKVKDFCDRLKKQYPDMKINEKDVIKEILILQYSEGGRVKSMKIGNIVLTGNDFRRIFSLKSTNFNIQEESSNSLEITTLGNGHGVGMSQWGANYLAKNGGNFEEILKYYYKGVEIKKIGE